jgi:ribosomal protein S18 acetylase RimI-like enzyme
LAARGQNVGVLIAFRSASASDVDAVVALVESAYRGESSRAGWTTEESLLGGQRTDVAAIEALVASSSSVLVLATDADGPAIVGCCAIERRPDGVAYFGTFAVRPGGQGAGIGKQLLAEAERIAADEWACTIVEMTVIAQREDLIAWYLRRGYALTGETRPFPYGDERFGLPKRGDLVFVVLAKRVAAR